MAEENNLSKPHHHAIMVPYPLQGHVIPFVNLAIKLASSGFTITFVNTQSIHHHICKSRNTTTNTSAEDDNEVYNIFAGARKSGLDIRYATVADGFPLSFDRSLNHDQFWEVVLHGFSAHVDDLVGEMFNKPIDPPLTCLVSDTFFVWGSMIARKYGLVNVSFWTEPALVFSLYYHIPLLTHHRHFGSLGNRKDIIDYIPGVHAIKPTDMTSYLQDSDIQSVVHRIIYKAFDDVKKADLVLCNTVQELEDDTITALHSKQPFYAIGPIFPPGFTHSPVSTSLWAESNCTSWLSNKPHGSVLYVSFGSYAHVSQSDILEIAHGLSSSLVSFIWVVRPDIVSSDAKDFLPLGFEDGVRDRGLLIPWCNQLETISHPAVGGFLTHCGWNSILESIWCGVPLLCFPLLTDQFTNRKLVVDDWMIGVNLCDEKPITREQVSKNIIQLMRENSGDELRSTVIRYKKILDNATTTGGSSLHNFNKFIHALTIMRQRLKYV